MDLDPSLIKPLAWRTYDGPHGPTYEARTADGLVYIMTPQPGGRWTIYSRDYRRDVKWPFQTDGYDTLDLAQAHVAAEHLATVLAFLADEAPSPDVVEVVLCDVLSERSDGEPSQKVRVEFCAEAVIIKPEGYGMHDSVDAGPIMIEQNDGRIKVWCWPDINQDNEPVTVDMEKAKVSNLDLTKLGGVTKYVLAAPDAAQRATDRNALPNPCPECGTDLTAPYSVLVRYDDASKGGNEERLNTELDHDGRLVLVKGVVAQAVVCAHCHYDLESKEEKT